MTSRKRQGRGAANPGWFAPTDAGNAVPAAAITPAPPTTPNSHGTRPQFPHVQQHCPNCGAFYNPDSGCTTCALSVYIAMTHPGGGNITPFDLLDIHEATDGLPALHLDTVIDRVDIEDSHALRAMLEITGPDLSPEQADLLLSRCDFDDPYDIRDVFGDTSFASRTIPLTDWADIDGLTQLAGYPDTDPTYLHLMVPFATADGPEIGEALAGNPALLEQDMYELAHAHPDIDAALVARSDIPAALALNIVQRCNYDTHVLSSAAENPDSDSAVLDWLASDDEVATCAAYAAITHDDCSLNIFPTGQLDGLNFHGAFEAETTTLDRWSRGEATHVDAADAIRTLWKAAGHSFYNDPESIHWELAYDLRDTVKDNRFVRALIKDIEQRGYSFMNTGGTPADSVDILERQETLDQQRRRLDPTFAC